MPNHRFQEYPYKGRPLSLPPSPSRNRVPTSVLASQDRRGQEGARGTADHSSKLAALKKYRKARGLCFKSGERWGHEHTFPATIQLHVVEELLELMGADALGITEVHVEGQVAKTLCTISLHALSNEKSDVEGAPTVLQLNGWVQGQAVHMLVDSGSTASFVNVQLKSKLQGVTHLLSPIRVKVADDHQLSCTEEVRDCTWSTQGHQFQTNFKLLALGAFDVILGQDWLYKHSSMYIDWPTKRLEISDNGKPVFLQGLGPAEIICHTIATDQLSGLQKQGDIEQILIISAVTSDAQQTADAIPPEVHKVLQQFGDVFEDPAGLPPQRACDHHIQLIEGAQPVRIRPYHHTPAVKDEIK
uniref:Uncharacterized protein n=1 Tax=Avena sativa TaxID=4498 RepID=A0ACD5UGC3_AVESA